MQFPAQVCPGTVHQVSVSNSPSGSWTWYSFGAGTISILNPSQSNATYTATNTPGRYTVAARYLSTRDVFISNIIPFFGQQYLNSRATYYTQRVNVRFPAPKTPNSLYFCSSTPFTFTLNIDGLQNNAADCFYDSSYQYEFPAGWTWDCPNFPSELCTPLLVTKRKSISVTVPVNQVNGVYDIVVRPNDIRFPAAIIKVYLGLPQPPTTLTSHIGGGQQGNYDFRICDGSETWFSVNPSAGNPLPVTVQWSSSGVVQLLSTLGGSAKAKMNGVGSGTISARFSNFCGESSWLTKTVQSIACETKLPGGSGFSGFSPVYSSLETATQSLFKPSILNKDAFDFLQFAFLEVGNPDTAFHLDHYMGFDYSLTITKFNSSTPALTLNNLDKQYAKVSLAGLPVGDYQLKIESSSTVHTDTFRLWSSCDGDCFMGIDQYQNPSKLSPVIYPIPGINTMTIDFVDDTGLPPSPVHHIGFVYTLNIVDLQNITHLTHISHFQRSLFDISNLQSGFYVVKVSDGVNTYNFNYIKQ